MLRATHLNGDASILLSFSPAESGVSRSEASSAPFTIVIDPWLRGSASILNPLFYTSSLFVPPCITSLTDIEEPDIVLVSHNKPDHCHKETLTTLSPASRSIILAIPAAAQQIKSWNHFKAEKIIILEKYRPSSDKTVYRHKVRADASSGIHGEVTVSYVAPVRDMTGLRVAIGITYCPPSEKSLVHANVQCVPSPYLGELSAISNGISQKPEKMQRALSVLYSPHGLPYDIISPYVDTHLTSEAALPLSLLMHCFRIIDNPWYLGGRIASGAPGGAEIVKRTLANHWLGIHDEDKNDCGFSVSQSVHSKFELNDVRKFVSSAEGEDTRVTSVSTLPVGEELTIAL